MTSIIYKDILYSKMIHNDINIKKEVNKIKPLQYVKNIDYDIFDIIKTFNDFKERLNVLLYLEPGDKISIYDNQTIQIDKYSSLQSIRRWFYNQSRYVVYQELKNIMHEYYTFLIMILKCQESVYATHELLQISDKIKEFTKKLLNPFDILRETYTDTKEVIDIFDTIQKELKEFIFKCH